MPIQADTSVDGTTRSAARHMAHRITPGVQASGTAVREYSHALGACVTDHHLMSLALYVMTSQDKIFKNILKYMSLTTNFCRITCMMEYSATKRTLDGLFMCVSLRSEYLKFCLFLLCVYRSVTMYNHNLRRCEPTCLKTTVKTSSEVHQHAQLTRHTKLFMCLFQIYLHISADFFHWDDEMHPP